MWESGRLGVKKNTFGTRLVATTNFLQEVLLSVRIIVFFGCLETSFSDSCCPYPDYCNLSDSESGSQVFGF